MTGRVHDPKKKRLADGRKASLKSVTIDTDVTEAIWADEDQKQRKIMSWPG
jgi:hypothetical protein